MSVMSAAEARQAAGASTEIPPRPLRIAGSAAGHDDAVTAGDPLDAGGKTPAEPGITGRSASALRVTQVRTVREVTVRTLRAEGTRSGTVPQSRAATQPGAAASRTRVGTQARMATHARAAMRAQVATHARVSGQAGTPPQTEVATDSLMTSHARVTSQARVTSRAGVAGQARVVGQAGVATRPGAVRLTQRGRRVVAGFVIALVIVAVTLLWMSVAGSVQASSHGSEPGSPYHGMTQVVVQPGQTLWSIAAAAEPSANAWGVVQQIINVNALSSANVQAGQLLWVPRN